MRVLGALLIAIPFLFGGIRWFTTGDDLRYLWTAVASTAGGAIVLAWPRPEAPPGAWRTVAAVVSAAACAAICAVLVGAASALAIAVVSLGFGLCSAGGLSLLARTRMKQPN